MFSKIKDLIRSMSEYSNDYDKIIYENQTNSDDELPLNKVIEIASTIIVARAVFLENNKYYPQVFLGQCLYKLYLYKSDII